MLYNISCSYFCIFSFIGSIFYRLDSYWRVLFLLFIHKRMKTLLFFYKPCGFYSDRYSFAFILFSLNASFYISFYISFFISDCKL